MKVLRTVDGDRIDRDDLVPASVIRALTRWGAFRLRLPEAHGGLGLSRSDAHRVITEIAAHSVGLSLWVTTHDGLGAAAFLDAAGFAAQRAKILPRLARGELTALAVTEEGAGTDPNLIRTTARQTRDGNYTLTGGKIWVTNGTVARWVVVLARAPGGLTAFLVDAKTGGFFVERRCRFTGLRGMENGVVRLRNVFVPAARRLGDEGSGLRLALMVLNRGRLSVAPRALGIARECLRISLEWTRTRRQHGIKLFEHDVVRARLTRLKQLADRLRAVSEKAAQWGDGGKDIRFESALSKLFSASAAWEAAEIALQLRGGRGYETAASQRARGEDSEAVERLWRDARGLRLIEGSEDLLRMAIAKRALESHGEMKSAKGGGSRQLAIRVARLASKFSAIRERSGQSLPAEAYALADEAAELFAEACATN